MEAGGRDPGAAGAWILEERPAGAKLALTRRAQPRWRLLLAVAAIVVPLELALSPEGVSSLFTVAAALVVLLALPSADVLEGAAGMVESSSADGSASRRLRASRIRAVQAARYLGRWSVMASTDGRRCRHVLLDGPMPREQAEELASLVAAHVVDPQRAHVADGASAPGAASALPATRTKAWPDGIAEFVLVTSVAVLAGEAARRLGPERSAEVGVAAGGIVLAAWIGLVVAARLLRRRSEQAARRTRRGAALLALASATAALVAFVVVTLQVEPVLRDLLGAVGGLAAVAALAVLVTRLVSPPVALARTRPGLAPSPASPPVT